MAVQDAVNDQAKFVAFEINAIIANPEAVQTLARAFEFPELVQFRVHDSSRQTAKLAEYLQLKFFGHSGKLGGAGRVKDDLEGRHNCWSEHAPEFLNWKALFGGEADEEERVTTKDSKSTKERGNSPAGCRRSQGLEPA